MIIGPRSALMAAVLCVMASDAAAQTGSRLAIGGSITANILPSSGTDGSANIGFEARLGHEEPGWGVQT